MSDETILNPVSGGNKLTAQDYWEWRASVEEMEKYRLSAELAQCKSVAAAHNLRAAQFEAELLKIKSAEKRRESEGVLKQYKKFLFDLETRVGFQVRDKVIDPLTFEVKDL